MLVRGFVELDGLAQFTLSYGLPGGMQVASSLFLLWMASGSSCATINWIILTSILNCTHC
jgi:hypothetical protein